MTKIGFHVKIRGHFWVNIFWVKITLVKSRVSEKPKTAHNFLNNARGAVLTPLLDIDIFLTFWG